MYDIKFFTPEKMNEFWTMVSGLLKFVSTPIMISVGIIIASMLLTIVVKSFKKAEDDDDDDRDFDIKYY